MVVRLRAMAPSFLPSNASTVPDKPRGKKLEILQATANGLMAREVAEKVKLKVQTVHYHLKEMRTAFGVTNSRSLVAEALRLGYIETTALSEKFVRVRKEQARALPAATAAEPASSG